MISIKFVVSASLGFITLFSVSSAKIFAAENACREESTIVVNQGERNDMIQLVTTGIESAVVVGLNKETVKPSKEKLALDQAESDLKELKTGSATGTEISLRTAKLKKDEIKIMHALHELNTKVPRPANWQIIFSKLTGAYDKIHSEIENLKELTPISLEEKNVKIKVAEEKLSQAKIAFDRSLEVAALSGEDISTLAKRFGLKVLRRAGQVYLIGDIATRAYKYFGTKEDPGFVPLANEVAKQIVTASRAKLPLCSQTVAAENPSDKNISENYQGLSDIQVIELPKHITVVDGNKK